MENKTETKTNAKAKIRYDWKSLGVNLAVTAITGAISGVAIGLGSAAVNRAMQSRTNPFHSAESNIIPMKKTGTV